MIRDNVLTPTPPPSRASYSPDQTCPGPGNRDMYGSLYLLYALVDGGGGGRGEGMKPGGTTCQEEKRRMKREYDTK